MIWNTIQIIRLSHQISQEVQTTAVLKKYESKLLKRTYYQRGGRSHTDVYTFFAPVMCYEADGKEIKAVSQIWLQNTKWEEETEYLICYSAINLKLFWFPEQKSQITLLYVTGLCISAVFFLIGLILYFTA
ncbi:MAG: hypothetical protein IKP69_09070 [Oscillospiraceae bacterium]|nr:hypothetical protein [Oscillospiraceae bacterium]